jgi:hypothetical protein
VLEKFWHFRLQVRLGSRLAGEAMTHFSKEKLVEFVRDALTSTQREEIQQHLHSCRKCTGLVDLYRRVVRVGSDEGSYAPPDGVVRAVKAYFGTHKVATGRPRSVFEVVFDSFAQPATAGVRASSATSRQLLCRVGSVYVDMEVDARGTGRRASITGQVLDKSKASRTLGGIPVLLLSRGRTIATTASDDNGEFQLEFSSKKGLELCVKLDALNPLYLPITSSQGDDLNTTPARNAKRKQGRKVTRGAKKPR